MLVRRRSVAQSSVLVLALVLSLLVAAPVVAQEPPPDPAASVNKEADAPLERPDVVSAAVTARTSGEPVEVVSERGETSTTWANADGTFTTRRHTRPVRVFDADDKSDGEAGSWRDVDTDVIDTGGEVQPRVTKAQLAFSDGGGGDAARLDVGRRSMAFGWDSALPAPVLDGPVVTYPDVRPGVDLQFEALTSGFSQRIVVHRRPTEPLSFTLPLELQGLAVQTEADGSFRLTRSDGKVLVTSPPSLMWDGRTTDLDGDDPSHYAAVSTTVEDSPDGPVLQVVPDAAFLADEATQYPVVIDPSPYTTSADTHVRSDTLDTNYHTEAYVRLGARDAGAYKLRSLMKFPLGDLTGKEIVSAKLNLYEVSSGSCSKRDFEIRRVQELFDVSLTTWRNQPSVGSRIWSTVSAAQGYSSSCPNAWIQADVKDLVQYFADGAPNYGIRLQAADETDVIAYKSFMSEQTTKPAYIEATYNSYPNAVTGRSPASGAFVASTTPTLNGVFSDPDKGTGKVVSQIHDNATGAHVLTRSTTASDFVASGANSAWKAAGASDVPDLVDGVKYKWCSRGYDGRVYTKGGCDNWWTFTVDVTKPTAPAISSTSHPDPTQWYAATTIDASWSASSDATSGVAGYLVAFDQSATTVPTKLQGSTTFSTTVAAQSGRWYLHVQPKDKAGNVGPIARYTFNIGDGAVSAPVAGDHTQRRQELRAQGPTSLTDVTFEWRHPNGSWATIPADAVTDAANTPIVGWPVAKTGDTSPLLVWDVPATPGLAEYSGPLEVRARFNALTADSTVTADSGDFTLDQHGAGGDYGHTDITPGRLNLLTGNFAIGTTDVNIAAGTTALTLGRTFNSRSPAANPEGAFGPGWTITAPDAATGADYSALEVVRTPGTTKESFVTVRTADGGEIFFTAEPTPTGYDYAPDEGYEDLSLARTSGGFTLSDLGGTTATFTSASTTADQYVISKVAVAGHGTVSYVYEGTGARRLTRIVGIPRSETTNCSDDLATLPRGCRVLTLHYSDMPVADATTVSRLRDVKFTAWDPAQSLMITADVARYEYDSSGRLVAAWDPRIEQVNPGQPLKVHYTYDSAGRVSTVTPPGERPWTLHYTRTGRLSKVTRDALPTGTATTTVIYDVPLAGANAPYQMGVPDVARWGQTAVPTDAAAVFPPTAVPADPPTTADYARATVTYLDRRGRAINVAAPGARIGTTEYDTFGNVVRELTPANRERVLAATDGDTAAQQLATQRTYSANGLRLLDEVGPLHAVTLSTGGVIDARTHTTYRYDEGAPAAGGPFHLPTTTTVAAQPADGSADVDARTTATQYDWQQRLPTKTTVDPGGLNLVRTTLYNDAGQEVERRQPSEPNGGGPGTLKTLHYTAGSHPADDDCGNRPEWTGLVCKTLPAAQPTTAGLPGLRVITTTYDRWQQPVTVTESVRRADATTATRTTATTYDAAARVKRVELAGGDGEPVAPVTTTYDPVSGKPVTTSRGSATITRKYDAVGRPARYTDAGGNIAETAYDIADRPLTVTDGKGTQTLTYDETTGDLTRIDDSHTGGYIAKYDADGNITGQRLPGGIEATTIYNAVGAATDLNYRSAECTGTACDLLAFTAGESVHTEWLTDTSTLTDRTYRYDRAGRLTQATDAPPTGGCAIRAYTLDANTNRLTKTTKTTTSAQQSCADTTQTSASSHAYDAADRITDPGYVYDAFGRTTNVPAVSAGGSDMTATYDANDLLHSLTQAASTQTFTRDPAGRIATKTTGTITETYAYSGDGDAPGWTATDNSWSRYVGGVGSGLNATHTVAGGQTSTVVQLANLHGDIAATLTVGGTGLDATHLADEFGAPLDTPTQRHGWLGAHRRETALQSGIVLMGVRLYNPHTGRFLSVDPVVGGSANAYDYAYHDPINNLDLDGKRGRTKRFLRWLWRNRWKSLWSPASWFWRVYFANLNEDRQGTVGRPHSQHNPCNNWSNEMGFRC